MGHIMAHSRVSMKHMQECLDKGGNIHFGIFDSKRKLVRVENPYFAYTVRIEPTPESDGSYFVQIVWGQGWGQRFEKKDDVVKLDEKPVEATVESPTEVKPVTETNKIEIGS